MNNKLCYEIQALISLIDTGSSSSIFKADRASDIDILLEPEDSIHRISGVGGSEFVFTKEVDQLQIGDLRIENFTVEIGAMDYGFEVDGIIGLDFLIKVNAVINLGNLTIH